MKSSISAGVLDTHVHTSPDFVPRRQSDSEVAAEAEQAGYRGVVLKSHHCVTADRALLAEERTRDTRIFGGVVMNPHSIGGVNPIAVETALAMGAKVVWLPTFAASNHVGHLRNGGPASANRRALGRVPGDGVALLDGDGRIVPELLAVLDLIASTGATLATGHASLNEI